MAGVSVRSPTIPERIVQELREQLATGRFAPGDRISVDRLAAEFDVSALPVREALRVFLAEGRVAYSPHRGFRVTKLTLADVEEIFLMCRLLEGEALRRGVPRLGAAEIERMEQLLGELETRPGESGLWECVVRHQEFHFVPIECAGLPRLEAELRRLWDHTDHYRALFVFREEAAHDAFHEEHAALLAACADRDAERAVELMNAHRTHAITWMARGFDAADPGQAGTGEEPSARRGTESISRRV